MDSALNKSVLKVTEATTRILCTSRRSHENSEQPRRFSQGIQPNDWSSVLMREVVPQIAALALAFVGTKYLMNSLKNPSGVSKSQAKQIMEILAAKLKRPEIKELILTDYEMVLCQEVVGPTEITTGFDSIGGLEEVKEEIKDAVIYPLQRPDLFWRRDGLSAIPKGILLFGRPGTGKTMLAAAIAKEAGATFLNIRLSNILSKWMGESEKYVSAVFSLAHKLQPTVIFMDEVDAFFSERSGQDVSGRYDSKTEFMSQWDGLTSDQNARVMVLGATNRPNCIDPAFERRLPRRFEVPLPDARARKEIFKVILKKRANSITEDQFQKLADDSQGYSGSDIKEVCRVAVQIPSKEKMEAEKPVRKQFDDGKISKAEKENALNTPPRPVCYEDILKGLSKVAPPGQAQRDFSLRDGVGASPRAPVNLGGLQPQQQGEGLGADLTANNALLHYTIMQQGAFINHLLQKGSPKEGGSKKDGDMPAKNSPSSDID
mmetsp:Transcript_1381/g.1873  ORF Transcript_1381/g.1873 Transcript_1381/m.1873 type:complete len:489 (+) Transcript_1381:137-1603(+)|eukprot:CAMPEP_0117755994 /NCGR_PEP_ID=MMETSP0947-20121206/13789_1 /TAXON_ID=44440 /ORGANISM="Chattonella subsalsa, Strain CCMP2191" /LENGTH=488 /DNA_ID=CAMNT_0005575447 /DNA_START=109 /DNA_END=1575 /DNA_ORIENTATION=+